MSVEGAGSSSLKWSRAEPQGSPTRAQVRRSVSTGSIMDPDKRIAQAAASEKSNTIASEQFPNMGATSLGRHRGKEVATALISKEESPKVPSSPTKAEGSSGSGSPQKSIKKGLGKVHQTIVGFFRPPSPQPESGPPSPVRTPSPTAEQQPAASPRTTALKELAKMPSGTAEERKELAKSLEALGGENAGALEATDKGGKQLGLADICAKLEGGNRQVGLEELLGKLDTMGISQNTGGDQKKQAERTAFIGALSKVIGPEATNDLVALALKKEINALAPSEGKINIDDRFRRASMAVSLYIGLVQSAMPEFSVGGSVIKDCMSLVKKLQTSKNPDDQAEQLATFQANKPKIEEAFGHVKKAVENAPDSVVQLNKIFAPELERMFAAAKERPADDQKDKYAKWDVQAQVRTQLANFLFLSVINPSISSMANAENHKDLGLVLTRSLQTAVNNDANNLLKDKPAEQEFVRGLHTKMETLVETALTKEAAPSQKPATDQPSVAKANARPAPPSHDAPPIPQDRTDVTRRFEEMVLKKLNMFTDQIQAASTSAELKEIHSILLTFERRVATTKNDYCKSEIADVRKLLEAKIELREQIEQRKAQLSPRDETPID